METYWCMRRLVVDVHKRTADVGQDLDLVLQLLADVVRPPERRVRVHDDVDLDVVVLEHSSVLTPFDTYQTLTGPLCGQHPLVKEWDAWMRRDAHVVRSHSINLLDLVRERRRLVDEQLQKLVWRRFAREQLELFVDCPAPRDNNTCANLTFLSIYVLYG